MVKKLRIIANEYNGLQAVYLIPFVFVLLATIIILIVAGANGNDHLLYGVAIVVGLNMIPFIVVLLIETFKKRKSIPQNDVPVQMQKTKYEMAKEAHEQQKPVESVFAKTVPMQPTNPMLIPDTALAEQEEQIQKAAKVQAKKNKINAMFPAAQKKSSA